EGGDRQRGIAAEGVARAVLVHRPEPTAAEVAVDIEALEVSMRAAVDVATGDRAAERMVVLGDRQDLAGLVAAVTGGIAVRAFHDPPAVVVATGAGVQFAIDLFV